MECFISDCVREAEHAMQVTGGRATDLCPVHKAEMDRDLESVIEKIIASLREQVNE